MAFKLIDLPYDDDALEPYIDARTLALHHDKHHAAYVNGLNAALEGHEELQIKSLIELLQDLDSVPEEIRPAVRFHGGGTANHTMYWNCMSPDGGGRPSGKLADAIDASFGYFADFKTKFSQAAAGVQGSGWAWLCADADLQLHIVTTPQHDNPISAGQVPLLVLDVWEHAYYLAYQNRRDSYIEAWWDVVHWGYARANFDAVKIEKGVLEIGDWIDGKRTEIEEGLSKLLGS
jgi:Fe-Mn family superoxide dismutase